MRDEKKTKAQLTKELAKSRERISELERLEANLKATQVTLERSEKKFSALLEQGNDGIIIIQDALIRFANTKMVEMTGFSRSEVLGKPFIDFVAADSRQLVAERYKKRMAGKGVPSSYEVEIFNRRGKKIPVEINASIIEYEEKPADMAIIRDITKRKKSEEKLKQQEKRYRSTLDGMLEGCQIIGFDWRYLYVNDAVARHGRRTKKELLGHSMMEMYPGIENTEMFAELRHCMEKRTSHQMENEFKYADGTKGWFELSIEPVPEGIFILSLDITERKQAEEAVMLHSELLDTEPDAVDLHDFEGNFVYINKAAYTTLGYTKEELLKMKVGDLDDEESKRQTPERLRRLMEQGMVTFVTNHRHKNGSWIPLEVHASIIEHGRKKMIISVGRDITATKKMQEQLIVNDRLASIGQLASGIAHEMNNPLTGVIGFSEMLMKRTDLPDDAKEDLKIVNDEAQRTARVVKGLLTFARKQKTDNESVDINSNIQNVLQLRSYEHRVSNIEVSTRFASDLPEVMGNGGQLQQVFINLIVNAEQAMLEAHNKGTLTIVTERVGDVIKASVADDGLGISKENMGRLFTPFFTTKEVGKGTGLGLSICHGIVTEHGGTIYAESEPGKGATFVVELPVKK